MTGFFVNMFFLYILQSSLDNSFYIGQTKDLENRLIQHNTHKYKNSTSTKYLQGSWNIVYKEEYSTRSDAVKREKQIKSWKSRKCIQKLIDGVLKNK